MEEKDGIPICRVHEEHIWGWHKTRACRIKCEALGQFSIPLVQFCLKLCEGSALGGMRRWVDWVNPGDNIATYHTYTGNVRILSGRDLETLRTYKVLTCCGNRPSDGWELV